MVQIAPGEDEFRWHRPARQTSAVGMAVQYGDP